MDSVAINLTTILLTKTFWNSITAIRYLSLFCNFRSSSIKLGPQIVCYFKKDFIINTKKRTSCILSRYLSSELFHNLFSPSSSCLLKQTVDSSNDLKGELFMFFMRLNSNIAFDVPAKARGRRRRASTQAWQVNCVHWAHLRRLASKFAVAPGHSIKYSQSLHTYIPTCMWHWNGGIKMHKK